MTMATLAFAEVLIGDLEQTYVEMQAILTRLREIADGTQFPAFPVAAFQYGPFHSFPSDFEYKMRAARVELIQKTFELLRQNVAPMSKLEGYDPVKLMNEWVGNDKDFSAKAMITFFDKLMADHATVQKVSLNTIMKRAHKFLPYSNANGGWGPVKDAEELIESGNALVLRAYSWRGDQISWELNSDHEFDALHKIIEIALYDMDSAIPPKYRQMVEHIENNMKNPAEFYLTKVIEHPAISRFRFFKNETLKIWFKNRDLALRIAKFLIGGNQND